MDQDKINRIKLALNAKPEKKAVNTVLDQFNTDTEIQLAETTLKNAGYHDLEAVLKN